MTKNDSRLAPRPNGSAFMRKSSPATSERPSGFSPPRARPPEGTRGSRSLPGRASLSREAVPSAARQVRPVPPRLPRPASATLSVATPTTVSQSRPPRLAFASGSSPVEVSSFTWQLLSEVEPRALGVTYWFEAAPAGSSYAVRVHLSGCLRGQPAEGKVGTFTAMATVDDVVPGSGRIAVTTRVSNLADGTWDITATPVESAPESSPADWVPLIDPRLPSGTAVGTTAYGPVVDVLAPGVRLGAWPALVGIGAALAGSSDLSGQLRSRALTSDARDLVIMAVVKDSF